MKRAMTIGRKHFVPLLLGSLIGVSAAPGALAHAPSGAIFTTVADGTEVNFNIYPAKEDVYLDGGPGAGAPQGAAGLDDGTYVFQVTDPSGKKLLSQDAAKCREIVVTNGVIASVVAAGCQHVTGVDIDHNAKTVQLMPYADTPNPGGEYKAWVVRLDDFLAGCAALGENNGLDVVDCGQAPGNYHGFIPRHTKTDNFKVGGRTTWRSTRDSSITRPGRRWLARGSSGPTPWVRQIRSTRTTFRPGGRVTTSRMSRRWRPVCIRSPSRTRLAARY